MSNPSTPADSDAGSPSVIGYMRCTCAALRRTTRRVTQVYDDALKPLGLKLTQYSLLNNLAQVDNPSITDLAERMMIDRTTLTRNLQPLQKAGWVVLGDGGDGRSRSVILTGEGRRMLETARPLWRQAESAVREKLGPDGGRALRRLLADASAALATG